MKYLRNITALMLVLLALIPGKASGSEELRAQLDNLRKIFDSNLEEIDVRFLDAVDKCRSSYGVSLNAAEDAATQKGDLDGVLKIRKEKARFAVDNAVDDQIPPGTHPIIQQAINNYIQNLSSAEAARNQQASDLARKYIQYLEGMTKKLTTESKIEEAVLVRQEMEKISADPAFGETLSGQQDEASNSDTTCPTCSGAGSVKQACAECNGTGKCTYCEGTGVRKGIGGKIITCFACTGSKKCRKCDGNGGITQKCPTCRGTGKR